MTVQTVVSADGANIAYRTIGSGSAVVVLPGALSTSDDLVPFAEHLASRFAVHIIERRGRGKSDPQGTDYSIVKESQDLLAVAADTDAHLLVGHSYGGLIALETALLTDRFRKIAVYEPGVFHRRLDSGRLDAGISGASRHWKPRGCFRHVRERQSPKRRP